LVVGVNGAGKTTSIGKLAANFKANGKKVLVAAADTFRAAAIEQLEEWTNRAGVDILKRPEGADPASVAFDAARKAKVDGYDIVIIDTSGRLHTKKNLMEELAKIQRTVRKELPDADQEVLIVLDGTSGQNAVIQAKEFSKVTEMTGIILTKLDGTAKGGVVISICSELNIPVKFIGVGEKIDDLQVFDSKDFAKALLEDVKEETEDIA
jgi:fused signal recognition particle receptor